MRCGASQPIWLCVTVGGSATVSVWSLGLNRSIITLVCCLGLVGCSHPKAPDKAAYDFSVPLKEVMGDVVDPAVWAFWNRSGTILDAKGSHDRTPPNPAGIADEKAREAAANEWIEAENGITQLIEVTNNLQLPGYVRVTETNDNGDWLKFAQRLNKAAHEADDAVKAKDGQKMFDTGGVIYQVCTDCHAKYLLPFIDPKTGHIPDGLTANGEPVKKKP
jgi:hypothetical protein